MRRSISLFTLLLLSFTMSLPAADEPLKQFEAREFSSKQGKLLYRMLKPIDYDSTKNEKYPLVVFLHGAGERGDDNTKQLVHGMSDFAAEEARRKHPCFVIAPQCPDGTQWVDTPWSADSHTMPEQPTEPMRQTLELIEALQKEFSIDSKRIYITGLSMGGYGVWDAVQRRPELFAAAVPICGGGDPSFAKKIAAVPVWAFHGDQDTVVKPKRSREMIEALKAAGAQPRYTEYPQTGHNSWTATYANREVHDWLFAQRKP